MATWNHKKTNLGYIIFVFVALFHMLSYVQVHGRSISSHKTVELAKYKGAIKTIQSEDGDVIDCVHIYKQPAFDHPLLKNHTLQMKPNYYPRGMKLENLEAELLQAYNIECPEGTVPILRSQLNNSTGANFPQKKYLPQAGASDHEYAQVSVLNGNYFGASARLNVWNPATFNNEFSLAQFWVLAGPDNELNTLEAGWITHSGQTDTRLFIYWTTDGYQNTGCYNVDCPGFVQISNKIVVGSLIRPLSTYLAKQHEIFLTIFKDKQSGNWWLRFQDTDVGYWPGSIFTRLSDRADTINWGGEIVNSGSGGRHTSTQMGSGHLPNGDLYGNAAYFRNLAYIDESGAVIDAQNVVPFVTRPPCYDLFLPEWNNWGTHFYFGGPGFSDQCQ